MTSFGTHDLLSSLLHL